MRPAFFFALSLAFHSTYAIDPAATYGISPAPAPNDGNAQSLFSFPIPRGTRGPRSRPTRISPAPTPAPNAQSPFTFPIPKGTRSPRSRPTVAATCEMIQNRASKIKCLDSRCHERGGRCFLSTNDQRCVQHIALSHGELLPSYWIRQRQTKIACGGCKCKLKKGPVEPRDRRSKSKI